MLLLVVEVLLLIIVQPSLTNKNIPQTCNNDLMSIVKLLDTCPCPLPLSSPSITVNVEKNPNNIYILYDVNPAEGFNLRRDVYIRMAVFIRNLAKQKDYQNVKLVLPPFPRLYHWRSSHIYQNNIFWSEFFDLQSLNIFTAVMDFYQFVEEIRTLTLSSSSSSSSVQGNSISIDYVYKLMHFEDMFADGVFSDKFEHVNCSKSDYQPGLYLQYKNITSKNFSCLKFQGGAKLLEGVIQVDCKRTPTWPKIFLFLNAEIVLHDQWGNNEFWQARRSMRFAKNLIQIANQYRKDNFNTTDEIDFVQRPKNWMDEKRYRGAKGGDYICAHVRRADFLYGREKLLPSLKSIANQIKMKLFELNLNKVFISSDCSVFEFKNLKSYLGRVKVYRYSPETMEQKAQIKDGGMAIIDQIICSHARYFLGTYESTFTYRIYEEREILGFPKESTFNTLCKNEDRSNCERNSVWPIVY